MCQVQGEKLYTHCLIYSSEKLYLWLTKWFDWYYVPAPGVGWEKKLLRGLEVKRPPFLREKHKYRWLLPLVGVSVSASTSGHSYSHPEVKGILAWSESWHSEGGRTEKYVVTRFLASRDTNPYTNSGWFKDKKICQNHSESGKFGLEGIYLTTKLSVIQHTWCSEKNSGSQRNSVLMPFSVATAENSTCNCHPCGWF